MADHIPSEDAKRAAARKPPKKKFGSSITKSNQDLIAGKEPKAEAAPKAAPKAEKKEDTQSDQIRRNNAIKAAEKKAAGIVDAPKNRAQKFFDLLFGTGE